MLEMLYQSPVGWLRIVTDGNALTGLHFANAPTTRNADTQTQPPLFRKVIAQLEEYFAGTRTCFDLPLAPSGTAFQQKVWRALQQIPYGETASYADLAQAVRNPRAMRAVGNANGRNPIPIIIPCHRVIRHNGDIGGYAGGVAVKRHLLTHEACTLATQQAA